MAERRVASRPSVKHEVVGAPYVASLFGVGLYGHAFASYDPVVVMQVHDGVGVDVG